MIVPDASMVVELLTDGPLAERGDSFPAPKLLDALYIALAEVTNSVLSTSDEELSRGHRARGGYRFRVSYVPWRCVVEMRRLAG